MKFIRRLHLYLGCFFAPLLLFYLATGWYQTLHPDRRKNPGEADDWIGRFRSVHVEYEFPDARWTQTFRSRPLTTAEFEALVAGAGLTVRRYLGPDAAWAVLSPGATA